MIFRTKEKLKQNKAITLIALVITIIILLILATIAIIELRNTKLFNKTIEAKNKYKISAEAENNTLDNYTNKIDEFKGKTANKIIDSTPPENSLTEDDTKSLMAIENICVHPALMTSNTEPFGEITTNSAADKETEGHPYWAFNVYGDTYQQSPYYGRFFHRATYEHIITTTYKSDWPFILKGFQLGKTYDSVYEEAKVEVSKDGKNFTTLIEDTGTNFDSSRYTTNQISDNEKYYYIRCTNLKYYGYHNNMLVRAYGTLYMPEEEYQKYEKVTVKGITALKLKGANF